MAESGVCARAGAAEQRVGQDCHVCGGVGTVVSGRGGRSGSRSGERGLWRLGSRMLEEAEIPGSGTPGDDITWEDACVLGRCSGDILNGTYLKTARAPGVRLQVIAR